jgi:hypothetical protein
VVWRGYALPIYAARLKGFRVAWMLVEKTADPSASLGMTKGRAALYFGFDAGLQNPQIHGPAASPKMMKNAFCAATVFDGNGALPFVIPSEAEGSAVPRTIPGNVFRA